MFQFTTSSEPDVDCDSHHDNCRTLKKRKTAKDSQLYHTSRPSITRRHLGLNLMGDRPHAVSHLSRRLYEAVRCIHDLDCQTVWTAPHIKAALACFSCLSKFFSAAARCQLSQFNTQSDFKHHIQFPPCLAHLLVGEGEGGGGGMFGETTHLEYHSFITIAVGGGGTGLFCRLGGKEERKEALGENTLPPPSFVQGIVAQTQHIIHLILFFRDAREL
ncbi:hypothetical protein BaRGS_00012428 [Batillaria attramentaria]|uniref:Uncharacterized protein n=1 Tax=Batillaria attramentaria TaxID=370345 RepID=A0ABD0LAN3_9CAEN